MPSAPPSARSAVARWGLRVVWQQAPRPFLPSAGHGTCRVPPGRETRREAAPGRHGRSARRRQSSPLWRIQKERHLQPTERYLIAMIDQPLLDLLAVDKRAVGAGKIHDLPAARPALQARMMAGDTPVLHHNIVVQPAA